MKALSIFLCSLFSLTVLNSVQAQTDSTRRTFIKTGFGLAVSEGKQESGVGTVFSIGWQKSLGQKNKLRLNPNMVIGGFIPLMTDVRDQYYRITSVGLNLHYDLVKYRAVSLVATGGAFINYSRGLLATGGDPGTDDSDYFYRLYYGGLVSAAIRIDPPKSRLAYEIRPITLQQGDRSFLLFYPMINLDFKLGRKDK